MCGDGFDDFLYVEVDSIYETHLNLGPLSTDFSEPDVRIHAFMRTAAPAWDTNGDGYDDIVQECVAGGDYVVIFHGPLSEDLHPSDATVSFRVDGTRKGDFVEDVTSPGDLDGDGFADVTFIFNYEWVWLQYAPFDGAYTSEDMDLRITADEADYIKMDGPSDLNGDGLQDLVFGDFLNDTWAYNAGMAWVVLGGSF